MVRTGEINKGIDAFEQSHQLSRASSSFDLAAIASANQSIAYCKLKKFPKAIELCRQAMEITAKMNSMKCFEYLQYARTLVSIYIKAGDFVKAEKVLAEVEFNEAGNNPLIFLPMILRLYLFYRAMSIGSWSRFCSW